MSYCPISHGHYDKAKKVIVTNVFAAFVTAPRTSVPLSDSSVKIACQILPPLRHMIRCRLLHMPSTMCMTRCQKKWVHSFGDPYCVLISMGIRWSTLQTEPSLLQTSQAQMRLWDRSCLDDCLIILGRPTFPAHKVPKKHYTLTKSHKCFPKLGTLLYVRSVKLSTISKLMCFWALLSSIAAFEKYFPENTRCFCDAHAQFWYYRLYRRWACLYRQFSPNVGWANATEWSSMGHDVQVEKLDFVQYHFRLRYPIHTNCSERQMSGKCSLARAVQSHQHYQSNIFHRRGESHANTAGTSFL